MERPVIITLIVAVTVVLVVAIGAVAMVISSRSTPEAVASASANEVAPAPVATPGSVPASSAPASSPQAVTAESAPAETQAPSPAATTATPQATLPPVTAAPVPTSAPVQPVAPPTPTRTPAPSPTPIVCPTGGLVLRFTGMTDSWRSQASLASDSWSLVATATLTNETGQTLSSVAIHGITIRTQQVIFTGRDTVGLFPTSDAGRVLEPGASLQLTGTSQVSVATDADYSEEARRTPAQRTWEWETVSVSSQYADNGFWRTCPAPKVIAEPF